MKLAVVIPTYKYHIPILKDTLESIAKQTCAPDLVVVRASSCDLESSRILASIRDTAWPFPLDVLETDKLQHTGQNKNEGVAAIPDNIDIISFFDSDDLMHPRRLEFVKRYISEGYDAVCHRCIGVYNGSWNMIEEPEPIIESYIKYETITGAFSGDKIKIGRVIFLDDDDDEVGYMDGPLTIRKKCFNSFDINSKGHQDCVFLYKLHRAGYKVVNLNMGLMVYRSASNEERLKNNLENLIQG